ncbi:MAG: hypothetical protein HY400_03955, partial [Elusimicrobia bacterium]|nr:hypothetical protein [Elusimicrobiota bacterium]
IQMPPSEAVQDMIFLSLGMRRLASDIGFIRLMEYYGTPEESSEGHSHATGYGSGSYPEIYPRALHILSLDPYYRRVCLYAAGALAFNLDRSEEAIKILQYAMRWDPQELNYKSYLAAIGYQKAKDPVKVAEFLTPVALSPECPSMIKQLVAFLNKKAGRLQEALKIYEDILLTTQDSGYQNQAAQQIKYLREQLKIGGKKK